MLKELIETCRLRFAEYRCFHGREVGPGRWVWADRSAIEIETLVRDLQIASTTGAVTLIGEVSDLLIRQQGGHDHRIKIFVSQEELERALAWDEALRMAAA